MNNAVHVDNVSAWGEGRADLARATSGPSKARWDWAMLIDAIKKFIRIDGAQRAATISHYAFFSLFPLIIPFVTVASVFIDHAALMVFFGPTLFYVLAPRRHTRLTEVWPAR